MKFLTGPLISNSISNCTKASISNSISTTEKRWKNLRWDEHPPPPPPPPEMSFLELQRLCWQLKNGKKSYLSSSPPLRYGIQSWKAKRIKTFSVISPSLIPLPSPLDATPMVIFSGQIGVIAYNGVVHVIWKVTLYIWFWRFVIICVSDPALRAFEARVIMHDYNMIFKVLLNLQQCVFYVTYCILLVQIIAIIFENYFTFYK